MSVLAKPTNMQILSANGQKFILHNVTGKVEDAGKNMETKISGRAEAGYYGARTSIQSKTVVHDQFFITDNTGLEHSFQLQGFNVACRSSNRLSVLWAMKQGAKKGPYIAVFNHSTATAYFDSKTMAALFRRPLLYLIGTLVLLLFLGAKASFFYWLAPLALGWWYAEGIISANRFKKEYDFRQLEATTTEQITTGASQKTLP